MSGWTTDTLHRHMIVLLNEMDRRYEQRFDAQERSVIVAIGSAERAVLKAEAATERRFEAVNEFRSTLADQATAFITRTEVSSKLEAMADKLDGTASRIDRIEATKLGALETRTGMTTNAGVFILFGTLVVAVLAIIVTIVLHH